MNRLLLVLVFAATLLVSLIWMTPLGFALDRSNLNRSGLSWNEAQGTVWNGRILGVSFGRQVLGDVRLKLRPLSLLGGALSYNIEFAGPAGQAAGQVAATRDRAMVVRDLRLAADIAALEGLSTDIRQIGGEVRVRLAELRFAGGRCQVARGTLTTDALTKAGLAYGRDFGDFAGEFGCEGGMVLLPMRGESGNGDVVTAELRAGAAEVSSLTADVATGDQDLGLALGLLGFGYEDGRYVYRRELELGRRP